MKDLKIFTDNIEQEALDQINELLELPSFNNCKIRIMPDVHTGNGCVIGFTADLGDKIIPNIVGVDIGCGMLTTKLGNIEIDLPALDAFIRDNIPNGFAVNDEKIVDFPLLKQLRCYKFLHDIPRLENAIGSLGGGNHFIEIDRDSIGDKYLIIHSGSRNLGHQVAKHYQKLAIQECSKPPQFYVEQKSLIANLKKAGRQREIQQALRDFENQYLKCCDNIPNHLAYLENSSRDDYLFDMNICQQYATLNRQIMADKICKFLDINKLEQFSTIHNYLDLESNMVRKGAISAKKDEILLIPINMRDGCIIGVGKGNSDWNYSAPHGAGRIMSRTKAKNILSLAKYKDTMKGIFSTSVSFETLDEAPFVYKPIDEIIEKIQDTVTIIEVIKPIYNFKASDME